jgi:hypothetical protein
MTVACELGGVIVRGLGCYGETAASRMLHPNRLRRNTHACRARFCELRPTQRAVTACMNCHGRGPAALSCTPQPATCP